MTTLEQRLSEINRRSKIICAQRKQRRIRILTVCIPAVLCIGLCAAFLLPSGVKNRAPGTPENFTIAFATVSGSGSGTCSIQQVQVFGVDEVHAYTDTEKILAIWDQLQALTKKDSGENYSGSTQSPSGPLYAMGNTCTIRLTLKEGAVHTYRLTGQQLTDTQTGCTYTLTQAELTAFNQALQIGNGG